MTAVILGPKILSELVFKAVDQWKLYEVTRILIPWTKTDSLISDTWKITWVQYSCLDKDCPAKAYAIMSIGIMGRKDHEPPLPRVPFGIIAYGFTLLWVNQDLNTFAFEKITRISPSLKLVPVQYREYQTGQLRPNKNKTHFLEILYFLTCFE